MNGVSLSSAFITRLSSLPRHVLRLDPKMRQRALTLLLILMTSLPGSAVWAGARTPYSTTGDFFLLNSGWAPQIAGLARLLMGPQTSRALLRHWSMLVLRSSLTTDSPIDRPQAAVALMEAGDPAGILATREILRHGDYLSKMVAVQRLAESGSTSVEFLAAQCGQQTAFAGLVLENIIQHDDRVPTACLTAALNSVQLETRVLASIALGHTGDPGSILQMRLLWRRVVDPAERGLLASALFALGDRSPLAQVRHELACGKTVDSRRFAALALGQLNERTVRADLVKALDDSAIAVQLAAAASLSRLGDVRGLGLLARAADDPDGYSHWLLENYMDQIDVGVAWSPILRAAYSPDSDLRIAAVRAIASRRDPRSEGTLLDLLASEKDSSVRTYIVAGLGEIGSSRAVPSLTALLTDDCQSVRCEAAIRLLRLLPAPHAAS